MRKVLAVIIWVLVLLVIINCGCTNDNGGNGGNDNNEQETGTIEVNFHVQEVSTTHFELYVDDELVSQKSQLTIGTYKWSRKAYSSTHTVRLTYYWDDWLGESYDILEETFNLGSGQIKILDWYDEMSPVVEEEEYEEEDSPF